MGRYREFIGLLMKYVYIFSNYGNKAIIGKSGFGLTSKQWRTLECIIEFEDEDRNMIFMANRIGLQKSSFSKYVQMLIDHGLVERYQQTDNIKDIILKPTNKGRTYYKEHSRIILESAWKEPFAILDKLSDENMAIITDFMSKMVADLEPENNKVRKFFKLH